MEKSRGRQAAGLSQGELPGSRAYPRTGAPALSQIVSHRRRSLSGVVVMCNPQGEKGPSQQPCPGVTVFPDQINYFLSPRAYQSFWRYSLYLPTFPSFSLLSLCPRGGLGADRLQVLPAALAAIPQAATGWRSRPHCAGSSRSSGPKAPPAFLQPRSPVRVGALGRGCLGAASPRLWGPVGLNKAQRHLKRDLGGLGRGTGDGREG